MVKVDLQAVSNLIAEIGTGIVLPYWRRIRPDQIKEKTGPRDVVTEADTESEKALAAALQELLPGSAVLGEEGYAANPNSAEVLRGSAPVWIIDPIDGTLSFARGSPVFGIMVALVQGNSVLAAWVHHPITGDTLIAEQGSGAFFNGKKVKMLPSMPLEQMDGILGMDILPVLRGRKISQPAPTYDDRNYICCSSYLMLLTNRLLFNTQGGKQKHFRTSLRHCLPWDDAANSLAIREAGGEVINWAGDLYRPDMFQTGVIAAPTYESCLKLRDWLNTVIGQARDRTLR